MKVGQVTTSCSNNGLNTQELRAVSVLAEATTPIQIACLEETAIYLLCRALQLVELLLLD